MSRILCHQRGLIDNVIPLKRYFLLVGGGLLALLFALDALTPRQAAVESNHSEAPLPKIRIYSELKVPGPIIIETGQPIMLPAPPSQPAADSLASLSPQVEQKAAPAGSASLAAVAKDSGDVRIAETKMQAPGRSTRLRSRRPRPAYAQRPDARGSDWSWTNFGPPDSRSRDSFAQWTPRRQRQAAGMPEASWARPAQTRHSQLSWFDHGW
ncbi:hypothetical protein ACNJX9_21735 [Bradyrhizobium sp. DASA03076]|uniref:hypothetical protein n=1 Tax=Bradyrhizobium sp. BLXBL-03 TaxID=3395916 RepID=UPI003F6FDF3D